MLWKECRSQQFYKHICKDENVVYLNFKNVLQPKVSEIIAELLKKKKKKLPSAEK